MRLGLRVTLLLHVLAASATAQDSSVVSAEVRSQLDSAVREYMAARHIPGVSLAIGAAGHVLYAEGFGAADLEHGVPVTPATLFRIQSTEKPLTATAVLRLAQTRALGLSDPVQVCCPAFGVRPWPVTIRELLSHQGGIRASNLGDLFNREHYASVGAAVRRFARDSLQAQPGTKVAYSNAGYTLLACTIEGAMGQTYDSALARLVLRPAGMRGTRPDNLFEVVEGRSRYYIVRTQANTEQWRGLWTPAHMSSTRVDQPANADPVDPSWAIGAGSYLATPADLVRFGLALMGARLLDRAWTDTAFTEATLADGTATGRTHGGWLLDPHEPGVPRMLGSSWNGSFGLAVVPAAGIAVAVASNLEFEQPDSLITRVLEIWRPGVTRAAQPGQTR